MGRRRHQARTRRDRGGDRRSGRALSRRPRRQALHARCHARYFLETRAMSTDDRMPLPDLENGPAMMAADAMDAADNDPSSRGAADLEAVFDVPVKVSAVLGRSRMAVGELLKLGPGAVLELDRKVGEAIDIYVNDRLVARGEVVLVEDK